MSSTFRIQRICQQCGIEFTAQKTVTKYCSHKCSSKDYKARVRAGKIEVSNTETQRIKTQPIEELKAKAYLSISETSKLVGISKRTIYRMIERGELVFGKAGSRTIIRRSDLDKLFDKPQPIPEKEPEPLQYDISECYTTEQVRNKYSISESGLRLLIIKHKIPKVRKGWYAYVPKTLIDKLLSIK